MHSEIDDEDLLYLVGKTDKELFDAGHEIDQRVQSVPIKVMQKLGYEGFDFARLMSTIKEPMLERVQSIFSSIYRRQDIATGGHIGMFMYRDVFARIKIPHIFGQARINLFDWVELTPIQIQMIQDEPLEL